MTIIAPILCMVCTRLDRSTFDAIRCEAYPKGIPAQILDGADHRTPRGDEKDGLVFNKQTLPSADVVLAAWRAMRDVRP